MSSLQFNTFSLEIKVKDMIKTSKRLVLRHRYLYDLLIILPSFFIHLILSFTSIISEHFIEFRFGNPFFGKWAKYSVHWKPVPQQIRHKKYQFVVGFRLQNAVSTLHISTKKLRFWINEQQSYFYDKLNKMS